MAVTPLASGCTSQAAAPSRRRQQQPPRARARDGAAGLPLASLQRLVLACVVVLCRRGTCGNLYHSSGFAAGKEEAIEGWDSALHRERDVHHPFERDLD